MEYGQWKTGLRQESLIYASSTVTLKIGAGISSALMTALLSAAGYVSSNTAGNLTQPQSAVNMIIYIYKYGPLLVLIVCLIALIFYKIEKQMPEITDRLQERKI